MSKNLYIKTYGCQMNVYDSIKMQELLKPFGFKETTQLECADMVILNTCHIREKASEKIYSELGRIKIIKDERIKQGKGDMIIVVAGCVAQAEGDEIFKRAHYVDIVVGPQSYHSLPTLLEKLARSEKNLIDLDFVEETKFDNLQETTMSQGASAFISVQEGCDKFCTFCVVPYTRGAEFSRPVEQIYREAMAAVAKGSKEIYLLGQNVNAYHGKANLDEVFSLADLISHISNINGLERIRYTTSHPRDMDDKLIALHGIEQKLMPFLHLPVQSGSNKILKAMNRKHTREEYFTIIDKLRVARPDIILSSDFIVGFPGETDEDFADTMDLVTKVRYGQCFSFKYSPRPGTPAANMQQVPEEIKTSRLEILQKELSQQQFNQNQEYVGKIVPVLFEKMGKYQNQIMGKTPYMQSAYVENAGAELIGKIAQVNIVKALPTGLACELI
ncbi:MAG: tRNA (N6-isopentenyl adenosine(37)-C2)-methylthiotransferase MiaB [Rickettsiaceae bacterium]|nr:tRNA (N6-isopentenyl adenosine(37)-C2)-methylthiotransferase MiaB [Rickettsiaceae bacterium]